MVEESKNSIEFIYCYCGCQKTTWKYTNSKQERHFIKGHAWIGKTHSQKSRDKMTVSRTGLKRSQESIKKQLEARKGYIHSEDTKIKISESHKGKTLSEETLMKISGEYNHNWIGDKVGYGALHDWVDRHLPKSDLCQLCNLVPPYDCACITNIYNRELKNWARLCRKCHHNWDNIYERAKITRKLKKHSKQTTN